MLRVDCYDFYKLGVKVNPLTNLPEGSSFSDRWIELYFAKSEIDSFFRNFPLKTCRQPALSLYKQLQDLIPDDLQVRFEAADGSPRIMTYMEVSGIRDAAKELETVLKAELNGWDILCLAEGSI